jgi:hypothetical protein
MLMALPTWAMFWTFSRGSYRCQPCVTMFALVWRVLQGFAGTKACAQRGSLLSHDSSRDSSKISVTLCFWSDAYMTPFHTSSASVETCGDGFPMHFAMLAKG